MNKIITSAFLMLVSFTTFATDVSVGRIVEIKGSGFISKDGKTKEIRKGDQVYPNSEIVVEHSGQVTFTDNADHRYHLGSSSSAFMGPNFVELRTGDVWFQSLNKTESYQVKTANAIVDYQGGEAILSYDGSKSKTQLMVINGMMTLSNLRTPELNLSVAEGNFSFVDLNYESGAPRDPTPVGDKTYKLLVSMFHGVGPLDKKSEAVFAHAQPKREIASVHEVTPDVTSDKKPIPRNKDLEEYKAKFLHKKQVSKVYKISKVTQNTMPINKTEKLVVQIFGLKKASENVAMKETAGARMPASVKEEPMPAAAIPQADSKTKETDKLLQALKNL